MNERQFVDHYEVLQVSPNADGETIERIYRLLAKRYHPDNAVSGNADRFREVQASYEILMDSERRAKFDVQYDAHHTRQWQIVGEGGDLDHREEDQQIFHSVLALLCVARRRDPDAGGLGALNLEKMLGVPREHLQFPIWYMRQRKWVEVLDTGLYAITVDGVDRLGEGDLTLPRNRLLAESRMAIVEAELQQANG